MRSRPFPSLAAGLLLLALLVVFFPVLFFGRVISPLDTVANDPPWRGVHPPVEVANPDLEEAATAVLPLQLMARRTGLATAVWNPHLACGGPGWLAWSSGVLSPTVAPILPWVRPEHLAGAEVLLRLLAAFAGTFLLLRRQRLSEEAAAIGAAAFALSGPLTANWLWPAAGTAALFPLVLWGLDRAATGEVGTPRAGAAAGLLWLAFAAGGAPGPTLAGGYLAALWFLWRLRGASGSPGARAARAAAAAAGTLAGTVVLTPSVLLWWRSAGGWGALAAHPARAGLGADAFRLLVDPFVFGDPRRGTFSPPPGLEGVGFHELCLAVGAVTLALALLGLARRWRGRWFWGITAAVTSAAVAWRPVARAVGLLPGMNRVDPLRLAPFLSLALACLAAGGWSALQRVAPARLVRAAALAVGLAVVLEQGLLAGHLTTYLRPEAARLERTAGLDWLGRHLKPGDRVAPLFQTLPPDTAAALGLDDIRSRFASPAGYRALIRTIDPQSWDAHSRRIVLNGATIDLLHPYLASLGARWVLEPPELHLVEYGLGEHTVDLGPRSTLVGPLAAGWRAEQALIPPPGTSRLALNLSSGAGGTARLELRLLARGRELGRWTVTAAPELNGPLAWIDLPPGLPAGELELKLRCTEARGSVSLWGLSEPAEEAGRLSVNGSPASGPLALTFDTSGYALAYEGPDLRIWENRNALPRFWIVHRAVPGGLETLLRADPPLNLAREVAVPAAVAGKLAATTSGPVDDTLQQSGGAGQPLVLGARLETPGILVSTLPATPPVWRAVVDGRPVRPLTVNGLFLGLELDAGHHRIVLRPALPRTAWVVSLAGCGILALLAIPRGGGRRRPR